MRFAGCWNLISALRLKTATFPFKEVFVFSLIRAGWIFRLWASLCKLSWIFVIGVSPVFAVLFFLMFDWAMSHPCRSSDATLPRGIFV